MLSSFVLVASSLHPVLLITPCRWYYTLYCSPTPANATLPGYGPPGNCTFGPDDAGVLRPLIYAGLYSHANYPWVTGLAFYQKVGVLAMPWGLGFGVLSLTKVWVCWLCLRVWGLGLH